MNSKTKPVTGVMVLVIGALHIAIGVKIWLSSGPEKTTENFWFTIFGVLALVAGLALVELERTRGYAPLSVLAGLAVVAACGLAFMPLSGFLTLLVPIGFGIVRWLRRGRRPAVIA